MSQICLENTFSASKGRVTKSYLAVDLTVFTQSETDYDNLGNVIKSVNIERFSTASGTGELTTATGRYQQTANWYDGVGRQIATANYGTNGGTTLSRPATVPARSDTCLVSETKYDTTTGRAFRTIDPAGSCLELEVH